MRQSEKKQLFYKYFEEWVSLYKIGFVREVTLKKYRMTTQRLNELVPELTLDSLNRRTYQKLINEYALTHEKQTTMDFHHQIKGAILDAVDEGLISRDPTRKVVIKGCTPSKKKPKFLNQFELQTLLKQLNLSNEITWDWLILLIAKTGIRFSEALAITPNDFDFSNQTLSINKTWNYKNKEGGFQPTKNTSSNRKIQLDWQLCMQFSQLVQSKEKEEPIFVEGRIFNSTINDYLARYCEDCNIAIISIHGLRHTHASLLLFAGVSIASVAKRLGHSNMTTTQQTYLHIIQELELKDKDKLISHLSGLNVT